MATDPLRIAVVGLGRIGTLHAEVLTREIPGAAVAAVADADTGVVAEMADRFDAFGSTDPLEIIGRDDIDAVAICSPTPTHVELVLSAAKAGKAIFCEKPVSLDLSETDRAVTAALEAGVVLQVGFNRRFDPGHARVAAAVHAGEIGVPEIVRISSRDPAPPAVAYLRDSGGIFLDQTIHDFDMARFVTGSDVAEVHALGAVRVDPAIGDLGDLDTVAITLRHVDGCLTLIDNSRRAAYGFDQRVEAFGSAGVAASENLPIHGAVVRTEAGATTPPLPWFFLERYQASYLDQWQAFITTVRDGAAPAVSGEDARAALLCSLAAARSIELRRPVAIDEIA